MHLWSLHCSGTAQRLEDERHEDNITKERNGASRVVQPSQAIVQACAAGQTARKRSVPFRRKAPQCQRQWRTARNMACLEYFFQKMAISGGFLFMSVGWSFPLRNGLEKYSMLA